MQKKRKNIFLLHMHFKNYRAKAELTFTPTKEKHMARNTARIVVGFVGKTKHCGWICGEDAKHCGWICGESAKHCGRMFEARFRLADYNC